MLADGLRAGNIVKRKSAFREAVDAKKPEIPKAKMRDTKTPAKSGGGGGVRDAAGETVGSASQGEEILDRLQLALDIAGLAPGFGEAADGTNALISLARGNYMDAGLSALSMLPLAGWLSTGGKWIKKAVKGVDAIESAAKDANKAPPRRHFCFDTEDRRLFLCL